KWVRGNGLRASVCGAGDGSVGAGPWELTHTAGGSSAPGAVPDGTEAALATSLAEARSAARTRRTVTTYGGARCGSTSMGMTSPFVRAETSHAGTPQTPQSLLSVIYPRLGGTDRRRLKKTCDAGRAAAGARRAGLCDPDRRTARPRRPSWERPSARRLRAPAGSAR